MAKEFKLPYTASEISQKLAIVDEIKDALGEVDTTLETKADLVDGKIPLEQLPDDIGGGLTEVDWETNVINKPFYDTRIRSYYSQADNPNPVSFDNSMVGYSFYKISDLIPTREEIFNSVKVIVNDSVCEPKESEIQLETDDFIMLILNNNTYAFIFINKAGTLSFTYQGYQMTLEVPEAGIYYILPIGTSIPGGRIIEVNLSGELKTLDIKYLPSNMALGYEETSKPFENIVWDGNTEELTPVTVDVEGLTLNYYKVSDQVLTPSDIVPNLDTNEGRATVISTGGIAEVLGSPAIADVTELSSNGSFTICEVAIFYVAVPNEVLDLGGITITFPEAGIWFLATDSFGTYGYIESLTTEGISTISPIDEKFIPDTIARKSDLDDVSVDLSNYYTKNETYNRDETYHRFVIDNKIANVSVDLSGYYTKDETYGKDEVYTKTEVDDALGNIDLSSYYTKGEVDTNLGKYYTKTSIDDKLSSYYTKSNVYTKTEINDGYYTKSEIDEITGDINTILDEINALIGE